MEHAPTTINHHITATGIHWNSPVPYLFGGMAMVLGLIAIALIILACTQEKNSEQDKDKDGAGKSSRFVDDGPKFVVIMAGAHKATFLAKPVPMPKPEQEPVVVASTTPNGDEQV